MTLVEAVPADIPLIQGIARDTWPVAYAGIITTAQIAYMLDLMYSTAALQARFAEGHRFTLAIQGDRAVGFAAVEHAYKPGRSRLHKLYVLPGVKGTGVGHALLEAVLMACMKAGDAAVELNVNKRNPAKAFYERHGFTVERDEVLDIGGGFVMDDHVMVRRFRPW
ncbi:MAG: GNAT family N-acetyltransferase [Flavobacteriales bacterium]|nr:putative N-acetyltransferase [Flavobacteriales bacterium]MCC6576987.1 GNAT family N-acetyltransferase [Flavobacteriales bacterium]NUQ15385.1 GNAT family N-acetyltransferase [Flavobacteriales bacterium]